MVIYFPQGREQIKESQSSRTSVVAAYLVSDKLWEWDLMQMRSEYPWASKIVLCDVGLITLTVTVKTHS